MIVSFKHKGLENLFLKGQTKGVQTSHVKKLKLILAVLNAASSIDDIKAIPALRCHGLTGNRQKEYAIWVNKNWRVTFEFDNSDVYLMNYEDYH